MSKPTILIFPSLALQGVEFADRSLSLSLRYLQAVEAAGGIAWVASPTLNPLTLEEMVRRVDGVMLTGGDDVQTSLYRSRIPPLLRKTVSPPDAVRDCVELQLMEVIFEHRKPLLAICRGHQLLNVAFGGTLIVDIPLQKPSNIEHRDLRRKDQIVHSIRLQEGSLIRNLSGEVAHMGVNSSHHQAVEELADPFAATAWAEDGVVEAFELSAACSGWLPFLMAVQYHPERLWHAHPQHAALFKAFLDAT